MKRYQNHIIIGVILLLVFLWWCRNRKRKTNGAVNNRIIIENRKAQPELTEPAPEPVDNSGSLQTGQNTILNRWPETPYYNDEYTFNSFDATSPRAEAVPLTKRRTVIEVAPKNNFGGIIQDF